MKDIQRKDILIFSRHSNMTEKGLEKSLREEVYPNSEVWKKFLQIFILSLAVGFMVSGIVFFFAYNWHDLNKFVEIGMVEGLIILTTGLALLPKINNTVKNIILTGSAVLVGVLFAVFGQIYQTGANAYDFFLAWTVFTTLWVLISNFAPLWLLYLVLINTTLILYEQQVADWSGILLLTLLFFINTISLLIFSLLKHYKEEVNAPAWFTNTIALSAIVYATIGIIIGILDEYKSAFLLLIPLTIIAFVLGYMYGLKIKNSFYLSAIPFSLILIVSALLLKVSNDELMLLFTSLFIVAGVTLVVKNLIGLHKKWNNEK